MRQRDQDRRTRDAFRHAWRRRDFRALVVLAFTSQLGWTGIAFTGSVIALITMVALQFMAPQPDAIADDGMTRSVMIVQNAFSMPCTSCSEAYGAQGPLETGLSITFNAAGAMNSCRITQSSGAERHDRAACDFLQQHYDRHGPMPVAGPLTQRVRSDCCPFR